MDYRWLDQRQAPKDAMDKKALRQSLLEQRLNLPDRLERHWVWGAIGRQLAMR